MSGLLVTYRFLVYFNYVILFCSYAILTVCIGWARTILEALFALGWATAFVCSVVSFVNAFSTGFLQLSLAVIFLERVVATFNAHTYEHQRGVFFCFVALSTMVVYATSFATVVVLYDRWTPDSYPTWTGTCLALSRRPWLLVSGWVVYAVVTMPFVPFLVYLAIYNRRLLDQRGVGTLSTRYQYHENAVLLRVVLSSLIILNAFGCCGVAACGFIVWRLLAERPIDLDVLVAMKVGAKQQKQITNVIIDGACTLHYVVLLAFHPVLGRPIRRFFRLPPVFRKASVSVEMSEVGGAKAVDMRELDAYFQSLKDLWG
ncbi:hypothetical protein M3Y99_01575500 [Aphelenchoides fujianensis]|nr:hypothetical protein M3Y99_01575500 [Aphelenchoides fujianensis]